ncbi:MAG TPA: polysaccharide deacetylase family protein [Streptosporangiaceae bacterium]|nr:polysaccharide deacetylase family protein [Streptosporangiaceae bacterium]
MWVAGVGWQDDHYCALVTDGEGGTAVPLTFFPASAVDQVLDLLESAQYRSGGQLAVVIDSVTGVLERYLVEAGLEVYRADPGRWATWSADGSIPAAQLAAAGEADLSALSQVTVLGGAMSGRDDEVAETTLAAAGTEDALAQAGQLLVGGGSASQPAAPEVALTFDDGPHPRYTTQILEVLHSYDAVATFFCIGLNAHAFPGTLEQVVAGGHEVGNHTWSHPYLPDQSYDELAHQIRRTNEVLAEVTGQAPTLMRPPYGARSSDTLRWLADLGMVTVLWNAETTDWSRPGPQVIEAEALGQVAHGSVVLMHDGGGDRSDTVAALPGVMDHLAEQGFRFVPVSRFLSATRPLPPAGQVPSPGLPH